MINFAGPFTLNLYGEIVLIISALTMGVGLAFPVALLSFFSAAYRLILYASTQQGLPRGREAGVWGVFNLRELLTLCGQTWPVVFLLLSLCVI